ncbi:glycosyltransferase [Mucilaginibacter sp.]|uniref:glycosyltransferase n=1 Tax=Mucilaginibacter sp. TaxID=1882438 RepID=UPI003B00E234
MTVDFLDDVLTVVIPTFNRLDMLKKILDTIPRTIRVIISDNGSSVPDEFVSFYHDFTFVKTSRLLEPLENWNNCINLVKTEWFTIPSDDDLYYCNSFELIAKYLKSDHLSDTLIFGHNVINETDKVIDSWKPNTYKKMSPPFSYSIFKYGVDARFPGLIFKKNIVMMNGGFDTSYKITAGDSKLIQQCLLKGTVTFIPEVLAAYRVWHNNSTTLTLGTTEWLNEIDRWQDEILVEAVFFFGIKGIKIDQKNIKDEVYAKNLIGGILSNKRNSGFIRAVKFINSVRFPWRAKLSTKLRILKALF